MDKDEEDLVADAIGTWATNHPRQDRPIMHLGRDQNLSPRQIASAVAARDENWRKILQMVEISLKYATFEEIIMDFIGPTRQLESSSEVSGSGTGVYSPSCHSRE